jgi:hypothetical protein
MTPLRLFTLFSGLGKTSSATSSTARLRIKADKAYLSSRVYGLCGLKKPKTPY